MNYQSRNVNNQDYSGRTFLCLNEVKEQFLVVIMVSICLELCNLFKDKKLHGNESKSC